MGVTVLLCAQDIQELHIAQISDGEIVREQHFAVPPERYLKNFADTLRQWEIGKEEVREMIVVTGPGSFTASRVSVTLANTLAFSQGVKLRGVENKDHLSLTELWSSIKESLPDAVSFITPTYDREATITQPKQ